MFGSTGSTSETSFGGGASIKPGINEGFTAESLFDIKRGDNWAGVNMSLSGPIPISKLIWIPKLETSLTGRLTEWYEQDCQRKTSKGKEILSQTEYLEEHNNRQFKKFDAELKMWLSTFFKLEELPEVFSKLPSFNSVEDFYPNIETYAATLKSLLPDGYKSMELSVILRQSGDYLRMPDKIADSGRYVVRTNDAERSMELTDKFIEKFMGGHTAPSNSTNAATPSSGINWNAG